MTPMTSKSPQFNKSTSNGNDNTQEANNRSFIEDFYKKERLMQEQSKKLKFIPSKNIDRIAENLRFGASSTSPPNSASPSSAKSFLDHFNQMTMVAGQKESSPANFPISPTALQTATAFLSGSNKNAMKQQQGMENLMNFSNDLSKKVSVPGTITTTNVGPATKIPNSKLFAKCFICSKLLSNQYNLRVHLETHQNMR